MATIACRTERKYDPDTGGTAALEAVKTMAGAVGVAGVSEQEEQFLDAIYYDTADLRLIGGGITLRRRSGGEDAGWHVKLPAGANTRDEIRLLLTAPGGAIPYELTALVRAYTREAPLAPVISIRTSRRVLRLLDGADRTLAEIAADRVSAEPAGGSAATSWDEIEAGLVTGGPQLLAAIDMRLCRAGARPAASATTMRRALADRLPTARAAPELPSLTRHSSAGEVVLTYLRGQVAAITRYDPLVRLDEPDAVHQMRVATRRARSALQAFGGIIEREATRPLCAELRWLAAALGQARDNEVLRDRLTADLAAIPVALVVGPVQARITAHFAAELTQARQTALGALDGQRYLRLLDDLDALLADPPLAPPATCQAGKVLAKPLRRAVRRLQRALHAVPSAEDRDTAIHEARKATKRARYAAEAAVPALGKAASRHAAQAKELQQLLGDHHNSVVARTVLLDLAGKARTAGEDTFTYGLMYECQACQATIIEQTLPRFTAALSDRTTVPASAAGLRK